MAKFKLVDQFNLQVKQGRESLYALCVSKAQVSKYDLQDSKSTLALLRRTNCAIIVYRNAVSTEFGTSDRCNSGISKLTSPKRFGGDESENLF